MSSTTWKWLRRATAVLILAVVVWRLGAGPFVTGFRKVSLPAAVAAVGIAFVTTVCSAYRWRLVARGLGIELPLAGAVAAYYRAQFLNTALPGGVLGDVHRGIRQGKDSGDLGRGIRVVVWERCAGQVVQIALAAGVLAVFPSPARLELLLGAGAAVLAVVLIWFAGRHAVRRAHGSRMARLARTWADELRDGVLTTDAGPGIVAASAVVVFGHAATFVIAAHAVGVGLPLPRLLPLALIVLVATALPINVAGWGPREGVAAWIFAAAGLGATAGVATATAYGVLVIIATLPGAFVLLAGMRHRNDASAARPPDRRPKAAAYG